MTRRRFLLANIRRVAIRAVAGLLKLRNFRFDGHNLRTIGDCLVVPVACSTRVYGNVRGKALESARPRNVDMAGRALLDMIFFATLMTELRGLALRPIHRDKRSAKLMASAAVVARRFLTFPVTIETRIVCVRHRLESSLRGQEGISPGGGDTAIRHVTDRAVVIIRLLVVDGLWCEERSANKGHCFVRGRTGAQGSNHILMLVMGKLDRELPFIFRLWHLAGNIRFPESVSPIFARRRTHVTDSANRRTGAEERLSRKELLSMTTDAGVMLWKVSDVGKITFRRPFSWDLVTGIAGEVFVFFR